MPHALTPRDLEVLSLMALGHSNEEIANSLVLQLKTVENYTNHIYQCLGLAEDEAVTAKRVRAVLWYQSHASVEAQLELPTSLLWTLSPRQSQVWKLHRQKLSNAAIALRLNIDQRTVGNHLWAARQRLARRPPWQKSVEDLHQDIERIQTLLADLKPLLQGVNEALALVEENLV